MTNSIVRSSAMMGTVVTMRINLPDDSGDTRAAGEAALGEAMHWFAHVEATCSRFEPESELSILSRNAGHPVLVSELLYSVLLFAVGVAERSEGAFDPTVGDAMVARGVARNFRSGALVDGVAPAGGESSFRDVVLASEPRTVTLRRPLSLDLGGVAKGMAIDLAARVLRPCASFSIDAGGDVYVGGCNARGEPWSVGIRHPHRPDRMIATVPVADTAVCTSATYERGEHLVDPRAARAHAMSAVDRLASVTVVAPSAMVADALATAAFVLGAAEGPAFLQREGVEGLLVRRDGGVVTIPGLAGRLT